jgi:hypothetical protein
MKSTVAALPSIYDYIRSEDGGPTARQGFAFQDRVAARCCLEMLECDVVAEVWCETYDDIVILRRTPEGESVEFIQVKNEQPNQLWTLAKLCARDGGRCGTSIFERSLARDSFKEPAAFRLVSSRDINAQLNPLKLCRDHADRASSTSWFQQVVSGISALVQDAQHSDGKDCSYWLSRMLWEVYSDNELDCEKRIASD